MLMTKLPGPARVTPHAERMLQVLRNAGGAWLTRQDLASAIGKRRLTPWDIGLLEVFVARGDIEKQAGPARAPAAARWIYRAVTK